MQNDDRREGENPHKDSKEAAGVVGVNGHGFAGGPGRRTRSGGIRRQDARVRRSLLAAVAVVPRRTCHAPARLIR